MRNLKYYLPGSILILMAIIIVAVPEVLVALVAVFIIMAGSGVLYIGHVIRKPEIEFRNIDGWFWDNDSFGWLFGKAPVFRRWYRDL